MTRRLIDVSHDIIVNEEDCGCDAGTIVSDIINEKENTIISSLQNRLYGRTSMRDVVNPTTGEIIVHDDFGEGVVISVDKSIITIAFAHPYGIKKMMKKHKSLHKKN